MTISSRRRCVEGRHPIRRSSSARKAGPDVSAISTLESTAGRPRVGRATGESMHRNWRTMGSALLGVAAAAVFVPTTYGQNSDAIRGAASPANHFIATPAGWVHPKTPWGEPDIQAMLNQMQAAGVPLER